MSSPLFRISVVDVSQRSSSSTSAQCIEAERADRHEGAILSCLYHHSVQYFLTGAADSDIKVWSSYHQMYHFLHWDLCPDYVQVWSLSSSNGYLVYTFHGHTASVTGLVPHPEPGLVLSCSLDESIRVWNLHTFQVSWMLIASYCVVLFTKIILFIISASVAIWASIPMLSYRHCLRCTNYRGKLCLR